MIPRKPTFCASPFELRTGRIDSIFGPHQRRESTPLVSSSTEFAALIAQYNQFPKNGRDLAAFADRVTEAFEPATIVLQVHNRLPGATINLTPPPSWELLRAHRDGMTARFQPATLQPLAEFFDTCTTRAYWLLSFLPAGSENAFPQLADKDIHYDALTSPPTTGGATLFVDTDDCNVWAIMHKDDPATTALLGALNLT